MISAFSHARNHVQMVRAILGSFQTNCYLLRYNNDKMLVVDPGENPEPVVDYLNKMRSQIKELSIYLTHGHCDHTAGVPKICESFPEAKIFACKKDMQLYTSSKYNLSDSLGRPFTLEKYLSKFIYVKDGEILPLGNTKGNSKSDEEKFTVIETPGHTPGSTTLKVENKLQKLLFTGDTLFQGSIGNTELLLGNFDQIMKSIMEKLYTLPDEFLVFPGHGQQTAMSIEKKENPFILDELDKKK